MSGNAPKILIVVLVVLVVLFVIGVGVGASGGVGSISLDGVISTFSGLFPSPALPLDEIDTSSSCLDRSLQRIFIPASGSCDFHFAASSANIRALKLRITAGASVHLEMTVEPVQDKPMTIKTDLPKDGKNEVTLDVYASGGDLTISQCITSGASACVLDVVS